MIEKMGSASLAISSLQIRNTTLLHIITRKEPTSRMEMEKLHILHMYESGFNLHFTNDSI